MQTKHQSKFNQAPLAKTGLQHDQTLLSTTMTTGQPSFDPVTGKSSAPALTSKTPKRTLTTAIF